MIRQMDSKYKRITDKDTAGYIHIADRKSKRLYFYGDIEESACANKFRNLKMFRYGVIDDEKIMSKFFELKRKKYYNIEMIRRSIELLDEAAGIGLDFHWAIPLESEPIDIVGYDNDCFVLCSA